jgi:hypothetical protein
VIVCPLHHYDFDLRNNGESETGMRLCTYAVKLRGGFVMVESPGKADEEGWELAKYEPVSEGAYAALPATQIMITWLSLPFSTVRARQPSQSCQPRRWSRPTASRALCRCHSTHSRSARRRRQSDWQHRRTGQRRSFNMPSSSSRRLTRYARWP